jgi:hypothetical protein
MLEDAYRQRSLPFLLEFGASAFGSPTGTLLQRAGLDAIRRLLPSGGVAAVSGPNGWREELAAWRTWYLANADSSTVQSDAVCLPSCEESIMENWILFTAIHFPHSGNPGPEPRAVITVRDYLRVRAARWAPWLEERVRDALEERNSYTAQGAGFLFEVWATVSETFDRGYFEQSVVPTLVAAIDPYEVGSWSEIVVTAPNAGLTVLVPTAISLSEMAISALEHSTGIVNPDPICDVPIIGRTRDSTACSLSQASFWQGQMEES